MCHMDDIRVIAAVGLNTGLTFIARLRIAVLAQQRHRKQLRQHPFAGALLAVENVCMAHLSLRNGRLNIFNNTLMTYYVLKTAHMSASQNNNLS